MHSDVVGYRGWYHCKMGGSTSHKLCSLAWDGRYVLGWVGGVGWCGMGGGEVDGVR
jgi:hypothetical protein